MHRYNTCIQAQRFYIFCNRLFTSRIIVVGDRMFLGMQDFDFAQIDSILPKTILPGDAVASLASLAPITALSHTITV